MKNTLTNISSWIANRNLPFIVISVGMIVMLLWAGTFKLTAPGAEGIVPLVSNNPFISWLFRALGTYKGSDMIGLTEYVAALCFITGYFKPVAGIVGGLMGVAMFFVTSTMLITTPGAIIYVNGMGYMNNLGLFLFKDIIALGACLYLISYYGNKTILSDKHN